MYVSLLLMQVNNYISFETYLGLFGQNSNLDSQTDPLALATALHCKSNVLKTAEDQRHTKKQPCKCSALSVHSENSINSPYK